VATSAAGEARLREKARSLAAHGVRWLDAAAARAAEPLLSPETRGALFCESEAHVRGALLARAFAGAAAGLGARIECGVPATGLRRAGARVVGVDTPAGARAAGHVVLCGGAWSPALAAGAAALPIEPVRGQILSLDNPRPPLRHVVVGEQAYLVPKRDDSLVVGATEERVGFDCRVTAAGMQGLLAAAPRLAPALADTRFRGGWAGLRPATPDGLPLIGPLPGAPGLVVAAGHHRNGVLLAPVTALLVADLVLGKALPADAAAFRPDRFAA
jgi:glycine oxidase